MTELELLAMNLNYMIQSGEMTLEDAFEHYMKAVRRFLKNA